MTENLQCALTGKLLTREKTIRFVIGPDNTVIADLSEELPGEGIRLLGYRGTLEASIRDGSFKELFDKKWLDGDPVISASLISVRPRSDMLALISPPKASALGRG